MALADLPLPLLKARLQEESAYLSARLSVSRFDVLTPDLDLVPDRERDLPQRAVPYVNGDQRDLVNLSRDWEGPSSSRNQSYKALISESSDPRPDPESTLPLPSTPLSTSSTPSASRIPRARTTSTSRPRRPTLASDETPPALPRLLPSTSTSHLTPPTGSQSSASRQPRIRAASTTAPHSTTFPSPPTHTSSSLSPSQFPSSSSSSSSTPTPTSTPSSTSTARARSKSSGMSLSPPMLGYHRQPPHLMTSPHHQPPLPAQSTMGVNPGQLGLGHNHFASGQFNATSGIPVLKARGPSVSQAQGQGKGSIPHSISAAALGSAGDDDDVVRPPSLVMVKNEKPPFVMASGGVGAGVGNGTGPGPNAGNTTKPRGSVSNGTPSGMSRSVTTSSISPSSTARKHSASGTSPPKGQHSGAAGSSSLGRGSPPGQGQGRKTSPTGGQRSTSGRRPSATSTPRSTSGPSSGPGAAYVSSPSVSPSSHLSGSINGHGAHHPTPPNSRLGVAAHWVPPENNYTPPKGADWDDVVLPTVAKKLGIGMEGTGAGGPGGGGEEGDLAVEWDRDGTPIKWVKRSVKTPGLSNDDFLANQASSPSYPSYPPGSSVGTVGLGSNTPTRSGFVPSFEPSPENPLHPTSSGYHHHQRTTPSPSPAHKERDIELTQLGNQNQHVPIRAPAPTYTNAQVQWPGQLGQSGPGQRGDAFTSLPGGQGQALASTWSVGSDRDAPPSPAPFTSYHTPNENQTSPRQGAGAGAGAGLGAGKAGKGGKKVKKSDEEVGGGCGCIVM